jgi:hypothetical protein
VALVKVLARGDKARSSFLKQASKKLLLIWAAGCFTSAVQVSKSFLRVFFQKSATFFLPAPHASLLKVYHAAASAK